jgi:multicomponent Na+:H+ antiporter subunit E
MDSAQWNRGVWNAGRLLVRLAAFTGLWWVLTAGDWKSPVVAGVFILGASLASMLLRSHQPLRIHLGGLLRFIPVFFWNSFIGGMDVALRAMNPRMPIDPRLLPYRIRLLPQSPAAIFFIDIINLLPGTLCAEIAGADLTIHLVDRKSGALHKLNRLEDTVARMFGETITPVPEEKPHE